ncbi:aminopeptidase [Marinibactrum halimedae]|uniref:Aminopeptidase n=1 Tax=Marinibactrum halimedae TaxID=1444977 RepID=A0AA37T405_9GAMM|nr:aminopeptidase [Marinibactrum halimedae]
MSQGWLKNTVISMGFVAVTGTLVADDVVNLTDPALMKGFDVEGFFDEYWSPEALNSWECKHLYFLSPFTLPRCMQSQTVKQHLSSLEKIALANDVNRAAGLKGYEASVAYIEEALVTMGYDVVLDEFTFNAFYELEDGVLKSLSPDEKTYDWDIDVTYMSQSEAGTVSGAVVAIDLALGEGNSSTSGCEIEDFAAFPSSAIALIQRGTCSFAQKAQNAVAAGAVGVIIFNQGNTEDRTGLINGTLGVEYSGQVPVFFTTYNNGVVWSETPSLTMTMVSNVLREERIVQNVIAETKSGSASNVIMVGAHLDSVFAGPGINDNGTGTAALLELANLVSKAYVKNKIRFAWWGAEEAGLVGSTDYVQRLDEGSLKNIKAYLNFDMIASPNYKFGIYDGDGSDFDLVGPPGSDSIEKLFESYFGLRGLSYEGSQINFRSDYAEFFRRGTAIGGLFTGAEAEKTEEQAEKYGGESGIPLDSCYHQFCDALTNVNERALEVNSDAIAYVVSKLANSTKLIDEEREAGSETSAQADPLSANYDIQYWGKHLIK